MKNTACFLIILLSILSCKKNDQTPNDTVDTKLEGKVILPPKTSINPANLTVLSVYEETRVDGNVYEMDSASFKSYTTTIVLNSVEEPLMMRYNYPGNPDNDISAQSTALAMLMNTPATQGLSSEAKLNLIYNVTKTNEFASLTNEISVNLVGGKGFIDSANANLMTAFKNLETATSNLRINSLLDEPVLIQQTGKQVSFKNNGVAINYWVGIYKDGQNLISVPINSATLLASSIKDLLRRIYNMLGTPSSVDYTFPSDGEYKVYIRSGRVLDNTEESKSALKANLVLGATDLAGIWLPGDCLPVVAGVIKDYIEAAFSAYASSVTSSSALQIVYKDILEATYFSFDLAGCIKDQATGSPGKLLKTMLKYLDWISKVGTFINIGITAGDFMLAKPSIDTCFKVANGVTISCNAININLDRFLGYFSGYNIAATDPLQNHEYFELYFDIIDRNTLTLNTWSYPGRNILGTGYLRARITSDSTISFTEQTTYPNLLCGVPAVNLLGQTWVINGKNLTGNGNRVANCYPSSPYNSSVRFFLQKR